MNTEKQDGMIYFPNQTLSPLEDLLALAEITAETIDEAVEDWRGDPPDEEFVNILDAEVEEE